MFKYVLAAGLVVLFSGLFHAQGNKMDSAAVVSASSPLYPANALVVRASGDIQVDVEIDKAGKVSSAHVVSGHPLLRKASEEAARRWQFAPAVNDEKRRKIQLTFAFRIVDKKAPRADVTSVFFPPYRVEVRNEPLKVKTYSSH